MKTVLEIKKEETKLPRLGIDIDSVFFETCWAAIIELLHVCATFSCVYWLQSIKAHFAVNRANSGYHLFSNSNFILIISLIIV